MSPSPFFCFYCRVPNNLQCRINSPPGSPARHKSPRQMHVRIACVQVLLQYIHIYYMIYYLRIVYAQFLYNIYCNMLKEDFSRRRTLAYVYCMFYHCYFVFYSTVVRLVSYIGIVQISKWFEIAHFRDVLHSPAAWL